MLRPQTVAIGGPGDDVFALAPDAAPRGPGHNFGVVMDFFGSRDDRLEFGPGAQVTIVGISDEADVLAPMRGHGALSGAPAVSGARVVLDIDGDGKADGFVLLGAGHGGGAASAGGPPGLVNLFDLRTIAPDLAAGARTQGGVDTGAQPLFNTNVVGLVATPGGPHGQISVLTAFQIGPNLFAERPAAMPPEPDHHGLLQLEDLVVPDAPMFG